jgi:hypothetical protein
VDSSHNVARISLTPYIIREHRLYLWVDTISFYGENKRGYPLLDFILKIKKLKRVQGLR